MDVLVIHDEACGRAHLVRVLRDAAHRVTLCSSVKEAEQLMRYVNSKTEAPSVVLIAENLLDARSTRLRQDLVTRFEEVLWIPLRQDIEFGWLAGWLTRLELAERGPENAVLNIVLLEPDRQMRSALASMISTSGDRVASCSSMKEAQVALAKLPRASANAVLVAPVICQGGQTISLFLAAQQRVPKLRWVVQPPKGRTRKTPAMAAASSPVSGGLAMIRTRMSDQ